MHKKFRIYIINKNVKDKDINDNSEDYCRPIKMYWKMWGLIWKLMETATL